MLRVVRIVGDMEHGTNRNVGGVQNLLQPKCGVNFWNHGLKYVTTNNLGGVLDPNGKITLEYWIIYHSHDKTLFSLVYII